MFNVHYFVEKSRHVEPDGGGAFDCRAVGNLLPGEEPLGGESKLQFVPVFELPCRPDDGTYVLQFRLPDAFEVVNDFLLFELQLCLVGQVLPFASATDAKVRTAWLNAQCGGLAHARDQSFQETFPLAGHLDIHDVARDGVGYKKHFVLHVGNGFAFGGDFLYLNIFQ